MRKLIVFSGLDGAGKSTQIDLLKKYFDLKGIKNTIIWSRGGYTFGMQLLKDIMRKSGSRVITKPGRSFEREQKFKNPLIRKVWLMIAIIDLFFLYPVKFRILKLFGYLIIADRYIDDTAIDFAQNFPDEKIQHWFIWKLLVFFCPKPSKHFVALIPVEESLRRSVIKNEPFPDSKEVLIFRRNRYLDIIYTQKNIKEINGLQSIEEVHHQIVKELSL